MTRLGNMIAMALTSITLGLGAFAASASTVTISAAFNDFSFSNVRQAESGPLTVPAGDTLTINTLAFPVNPVNAQYSMTFSSGGGSATTVYQEFLAAGETDSFVAAPASQVANLNFRVLVFETDVAGMSEFFDGTELDLFSVSGLSNSTGGGSNGGDGTTTPIPLPAAGWLMIAGLGGLAALRRRKSQSSG